MSAVVGLYAMLAAGGMCTTCSRTVALDHVVYGLADGARMRRGQFETHPGRADVDYCIRRLGPDGWTGCGGT